MHHLIEHSPKGWRIGNYPGLMEPSEAERTNNSLLMLRTPYRAAYLCDLKFLRH